MEALIAIGFSAFAAGGIFISCVFGHKPHRKTLKK